MKDGRRRYGDPRKAGRPSPARGRWVVLEPGPLLAAGFCLLVVAGIVVAAVVSTRRGDSEFDSAAGLVLVAIMCLFFATIAVALLSERLASRAWRLWEAAVVALLVVMGLALLLLTGDFVTGRPSSIRSPDTAAGGRVLGAILLVLGLLRAAVLLRRRH